MKFTKVSIDHTCQNVDTINPNEAVFESDDQSLISKIAAIVFAEKTHKHYWLISESPRQQVSELLGINIRRDSFVWFE